MPKSRRKPKIKGMPADRDFRIPVCRRHQETKAERNMDGDWVCPDCADEWLRGHLRKKLETKSKGIILPAEVQEAKLQEASWKDLQPNRAEKRRAKRLERRR